MSHLPEGNRKAALDIVATSPRTNLSVQLRSSAYREIIAEVRRTHAEVNRRTEQARQMTLRHTAKRQRVENAERVTVPRESITPAERPRFNFEPIQFQRTVMGIPP